METIVMFYRWPESLRSKLEPASREQFDQWQHIVVNELNSKKTDGQTFDLILHYQDSPSWEVVLVPVTLPA